ncbi:MAG: triphosphoribosyl-dephospho-CoA synthase [Hyphomicrobiaceae bacterium]
MPALIKAASIAEGFIAACQAELSSLKPGNVHDFASGHRMDTGMFTAAAAAAAPFIAQPGLSVGARIERAVTASVAAAGCNTNLGIILLCVPLACAAQVGEGPLRVHIDEVLDGLTVADAQAVYRAITIAKPAGLGAAKAHDVHEVPNVTLLEAMTAAREHDRIANAYANDFADLFDFALPALTTARLSAASPDRGITTLHMCLLDQFPDTHIARKFGPEIAHGVQIEAHRLRPHFLPAVNDDGFQQLLNFDADLKARGLNPGTTADFVVATLFADQLLTRNRTAKSS